MGSTEETFVPVLLLTFLSYPFFVRSEICYRCVDEFIVMHWGYFLPIQAEHELIADSSCIKTNERTEEVRCVGACLTLNVTAENNRTRTIGMMRDCQKKYYSRDWHKDDKNRKCQNQTVQFRQHKLNAEYCFCLGSYCNSNDDNVHLRNSMNKSQETMKHIKNRNNRQNDTNRGRSLYSIQCLMVIFVTCLKIHLINL